MEIDITAVLGDVDFAPKGLTEILQNVRTILSTVKGTVPLDREFGVSATYLDAPIPLAQAKLTAEIITAVHRYEPRVQITGVTYIGDGLDGKLAPEVQVKVRDV